MNSTSERSKFNVTVAASWLLLVVLVTLILQSLSFLFIPLCFAILACYALGIPLDFLKRFRLPGFVRIILVVGLVTSSFHDSISPGSKLMRPWMRS
jgi:predicted PurR-regulated permease PerM